MTPEHQETLLQTIQARLERNEKSEVRVVCDPAGPWTIVKYFTPAWVTGFDKYGRPIGNEDGI